MKKIRILTFWGVPNHGCFLQAYALQKVLQEYFPDEDVKQIAYLNNNHYSFYYKFCMPRDFKWKYLNPNFYRALLREVRSINNKKELQKYLEFYSIIPNDGSFKHVSSEIESCDTLVLGSDIIWDYTTSEALGDEVLFGRGIIAKKKISYAPSFCNSSENNYTPNYIINGIKELDAISVRDRLSAEKIKSILKQSPIVVPDPTFLYDFKSDIRVKKHVEDKPYIAVYGTSFDKNYVNGLLAFAKKKGYFIINLEFVQNSFSWADKNVKQKDLNPMEWLGYLWGAEYIMTSTYHGFLFSLQFNKKIIFMPTKFILNKAEDLIDFLGLREILIQSKSFEQKINYEWDYDKLIPKMKKYQEIGINYLKTNC